MRVMFDSQIFSHQRFGGISRYFANLAGQLQLSGDVTPRIVAPFHFNEYAAGLPASLVDGRRVPWLEDRTALAYGINLIAGWRPAHRFNPDIAHQTFYFPARQVQGARVVLTVFDMIHELFPDAMPSNRLIARWKRESVTRADHVICISANTRSDLMRYCEIDPAKVSVVPIGHDSPGPALSAAEAGAFRRRVLGVDAPFLLYVGKRGSYKNFATLLEAYSGSASLTAGYFLLCFGGGSFSADEQAGLRAAGVAGRVCQVSGSDDELARCYSSAALFVYPSLYEGFGMPPLEAMSLDCPVACSAISSLPEVVGDAAALFDPADVASLRSVLEATLASPATLDGLVARGRVRRNLFSWHRCAEETLQVYRTVLSAA